MDLYLKLIDVIVPVFALIGVGYYLGKKDPTYDTKFITIFAAKFGSPALAFYAITSTGIEFNLFINYFFYTLLAVVGFSIIGVIFLVIQKKDYISELPPLVFPNCGNMGLPICLFAYGKVGLGISSAIAAVIIISHFTIGIFLASKKISFRVLLESIPVYAVLIAVGCLYYNVQTPKFIENTAFLLAYSTIALVLMSLGVALTKLKVFSLKNAIISSFARLILGPLVALGLIFFFDLKGVPAGVLFIQCSMPSAILTYLVGSMHSSKKVVNSIAGTIVVSTVVSFLTIPVIVFIALKYFF
ncbi:AEC family transporter [Pelagibacteraceae bacterium]|jgi:predicted permease|nr:AEC family transporter [Pelagibacteraceae bacterium]|tara:strand:- start:53 stop:952 length:900 start_codon:yes stop_codon:yes gene_type:complete